MAQGFVLSKRLRTVKEAVAGCNCLADIGCDHGYVSISLMRDAVAQRIIACDINKGPLNAAVTNIEAAGFADKIETRLSDGLHKISTSDKVDTLVIAGMGGRLMTKILQEGIEVSANCFQLVLQPQSEQFLVRGWLRDNEFRIEREFMVEDMGKFYWIIDARKGSDAKLSNPELQSLYDRFSGYLIEHKDEVLKKYIMTQLELNRQYLKGIADSGSSRLEEDIKYLEKALQLMS